MTKPFHVYQIRSSVQLMGQSFHQGVEVSARTAINALRVAQDALARKYSLRPSLIEILSMSLVRTSKTATQERVIKYL